MTLAAIGKGTKVSDTIGYLLTDTNLSTSGAGGYTTTVVKDALAKSKDVWDSYLKSGSPNPAWPGGGTVYSVYPSRVVDSAYYYAVEFVAEEFIRIRIGNVGSAQGSQIQQLLLSKAQALLSFAQAGIQRYEQWCAGEAGIMGANTMELLDNAVAAGYTGSEEAINRWITAVSDLDPDEFDDMETLALEYVERIRQAAYGFSLRLLAGELAQRKLGFAGARLATIASYYAAQAQSLLALGDRLVGEFMAWVAETKQILLAVKLYKQRPNAYSVITMVADTIPQTSESLFRVRSLVSGRTATFSASNSSLWLVLYCGTAVTPVVYWWDSVNGYTMPVKVMAGGILALDYPDIPDTPAPGIYRGELVSLDPDDPSRKIGAYEIYINIEWPAATAYTATQTLRAIRSNMDIVMATDPKLAKLPQLQMDDFILCQAAFNACQDWNTIIPDFTRKVTPDNFKEVALFRDGIAAHAMMIKGNQLMQSAMGVADTKAGNVHAYEQKKADQLMQLGAAMVKAYRDQVVRTQLRIWNNFARS